MPRARVPMRASDFDADALAGARAASGTTVSVCLPARDEEATIGRIVSMVRRTLVERVPLVDEIVVMDDGSTDATADVADGEGARVVSAGDVLPEAGPGQGKGNALWTSLYACRGDVICWVDADIRNFASHFVTGLLGPLLTMPDIAFTKGFYRRPTDSAGHGGGRVTELMARPLVSHLYPALSRFVQPLSGEYAGRRELLEAVPFVQGWGVEIGLLIDITQRFGLDAVAQVDLGVREHRNRPLSDLGPQAMAILVTALRKAGLAPGPAVEELVRFGAGHEIERVPVEVRERPPMREIPAYRARFGRELIA